MQESASNMGFQPKLRLQALLGIFAFALCLAVLLPQNAHADDFQLWTRIELQTPLDSPKTQKPKWILKTQSFLRLGVDASGMSLLAVAAGPEWRPVHYFNLGLNGYAGVESAGGSFLPDYRLRLDPTFSFSQNWFRISNRLRLEARWSNSPRPFRYRDLLTLGFRVARNVELVLSAEFFISHGEGFSQYRAFSGARIKTPGHGEVEVGYLNVGKQSSSWDAAHVLNVGWLL